MLTYYMSHFLKDILNINEIDIILISLFSSEKIIISWTHNYKTIYIIFFFLLISIEKKTLFDLDDK